MPDFPRIKRRHLRRDLIASTHLTPPGVAQNSHFRDPTIAEMEQSMIPPNTPLEVRAIHIDPLNKLVRELKFEGNKTIHSVFDKMVTRVSLGDGNVLIVLDMAREDVGGFLLDDRAFIGPGLLVGRSPAGSPVSPTIELSQVRHAVDWLSFSDANVEVSRIMGTTPTIQTFDDVDELLNVGRQTDERGHKSYISVYCSAA